MTLELDTLLAYTTWEREQWHEWLRSHGDEVLALGAGPHGDGRFQTIGDLIRHIFSAEKRYVDRLSGRPLTDTAAISNNNTEALFAFAEQSRHDLQLLLNSFPADRWDLPQDHKLLPAATIRATPRKIIIHVLTHEIRHWAQIATLLRLNGQTSGFHDFLFSPVLGGGVMHEQEQASLAK